MRRFPGFLIVLLAWTSAQAEPVVQELRTTGVVQEQAALDLDGDGRKELLFIAGRDVMLFRLPAGPAARFSETPDQVFRLGPRVGACALGRAGQRPALWALGEGVQRHPFQDGAFSVLPERPEGLPAASLAADPEGVRYRAFARDFNGDGEDDLLLPGKDCYFFLPGRAGGAPGPGLPVFLVLTASVNTGGGVLETLESEFGYPWPHTGDVTGDGRPDLILRYDRSLAVHPQQETGGYFEPTPAYRITLDFLVQEPAEEPRSLVPDFDLPLTLADLNGDGLLDIAHTAGARGKLRVFLGRPDRRSCEKPDALIKVDGHIAQAQFVDLTGDGLSELILPTMDRVGLVGALRILMSKTVQARVLVYRNRWGEGGGALYPLRPDRVRDLAVGFRLARVDGELSFGTTLVVTGSADVDGDGRKDLVQKTDDETLAFHLRRADGELPDEPNFTVKIPDTRAYRFIRPVVDDLDGDGRDDIILMYRDWRRSRDRVVVVRVR